MPSTSARVSYSCGFITRRDSRRLGLIFGLIFIAALLLIGMQRLKAWVRLEPNRTPFGFHERWQAFMFGIPQVSVISKLCMIFSTQNLPAVILLASLAIMRVAYAQSVVVVPNENANAFGNTGSKALITLSPQTYQVQIAASQLTGISSGDSIVGVSWRLYSGATVAFPASNDSFATYKIILAQAANTVATMSDTFASNMVSPAVVYSSSLTFSTGAFSSGSTPNPFGPVITFDTPYTYTGGDLVVYYSMTGADLSPGSNFFDVQGTEASGYGTLFRAKGGSAFFDGPSGVDSAFLVQQFSFTSAIPEPAGAGLVAAGAVLTAGGVLRRRRK